MANHDVNLAAKSNKFKLTSLNECLNNSYTMRTYLKGKCAKNKRQCTDPTKLVPIIFVELKIKQEKDEYILLKAIFYSGASSTLDSQAAVRHLEKTVTKSTVFSMAAGNISTHRRKKTDKIKIPRI